MYAKSKEEQQVAKLHQMIKDGSLTAVTKFIQSLKADAKDICSKELKRDATSLHLAARLGHVDITKEILKTGISVNIRQIEGHVVSGKTALHEATSNAHFGEVEYLLTRGAEVNAQEADGQTALHMACMGDNIDIVKCLIRNGINVNLCDNKKQYPLQVSILRAPDETTRYLLNSGADITITDNDGQTPLHYASEWGNKDLVEILLKKGAKPNQQDDNGSTALHLAEDEAVFDLLVAHGGDNAIRNLQGKPPREERLDMEKEEFQNINKALAGHLTKKRAPQIERLESAPRRVYSPGPPIAEVELKSARSNMLQELLSKRGATAATTQSDPDEDDDIPTETLKDTATPAMKSARANMLQELLLKKQTKTLEDTHL